MRMRHTVAPLLAALSLAAVAPAEAAAAPPVAPPPPAGGLPRTVSFQAAADLPGPAALAPGPDGYGEDGVEGPTMLLGQAVDTVGRPVRSLVSPVLRPTGLDRQLSRVPVLGGLFGDHGEGQGAESQGSEGGGGEQQGDGAAQGPAAGTPAGRPAMGRDHG
ncbi:hypothetical protein [Streptomyces sp. NPDC049585]|uniref:hypothetical protein n=1 Tax=Streptomyces sp. NPDC049585 TaxID=3155154 RepID=UPI0034171A4C